MDPIAFSIPIHLGKLGQLDIRWYGIMMAASMLLGAFIAAKLLRRIGRNGELVWDGLFWIILFGVIGARIVYVLTNLSQFGPDPWVMFKVWHGGLSFHGGIIAGLIATYVFFKNHAEHFAASQPKSGTGTGAAAMLLPPTFIEVMDAFAPGVSLGIILVRIGNFMNGDILGYKWDGPWAMNFPSDAYHLNNAGAIVMRHPTEIYGMLVGLICALLAMVIWIETYETRRFPPGANYLGFVLSYSLVRSLIEEPFRDVPLPWKVVDPATHGYGLFTTTQLASILLILLAIWGMTQLRKWERLRDEAAKRPPRSGGSGGSGGRPVSSITSVARPGQTRQARRALEREQQKKTK